MPDTTDILLETLRDAQRLGFFGPGSIEDAMEHAHGFVAAISDVPAGSRLVDLGSGGGLPGLVIAVARPECTITLIDRREKRTDFLRRAVRRLGLDRTDVRTGDVRSLVRDVAVGAEAPFDAVTARGFGPPDQTLRLAIPLLDPGSSVSSVVISEPPTGDRWDPDLLAELDVTGERIGPVRRFRRASMTP